MFKRCFHRWIEESREYTPPAASVDATGYSGNLLLKLAMGITSVELKCEKCGDVKFSTVPGKAL